MRHLKKGRKLNRSPSHRLALMRNLVTSLLRHDRIETTDPKAKELRRWSDWMIGLGKKGSLHARRQALAVIYDKEVVRKVFDTLAPRFKNRPGGYTRTVKIGLRRGDNAPLSLVEIIPEAEASKAEPSTTEGKAKGKPTTRKRRPRKKTEPGAAA